MSLRRKGSRLTEESWHRDVAEHQLPGDVVYGGWINLDLKESQFFSCVPSTHKDRAQGTASGFALIKDEASKKAFAARRKLIEVPPGHQILFHQNIVHEVRKQPGN